MYSIRCQSGLRGEGVEKVKYVTFDDGRGTVRMSSCPIHRKPRKYEPWYPVVDGLASGSYGGWKRMFAGMLYDGLAEFQPTSGSNANKAYRKTVELFGLGRVDNPHPEGSGDWREHRECWIDSYLVLLGKANSGQKLF